MIENSNTDEYASDMHIDELLNGFIDGELTPRQQTEVERLVAHDIKIARQLQRLQKCKALVSSMPHAEAPAQVLHGIRSSLARIAPLHEEGPVYDERAGRIQLLARRLLSAAAMIGLMGVLAAVIYAIIVPQATPETPVAIGTGQPENRIDLTEPSPAAAGPAFCGRLELKTSSFAAVDAFVNRAIEENELSDSASPIKQRDKGIYYISCSRQGLDSLLADLDDIWSKLDSATLLVDSEVFGKPVVVDAVTPEQIAEIVHQDNPEKRIDAAKSFAVLNNMAEQLPGRGILAAIEGQNNSLMTIPKPVLTGNSKRIRKPAGQAEDGRLVRLTITVSW
ncbi:MAG: hypothetical protein ABIF19_07080 [Planctomycetota bacterium]